MVEDVKANLDLDSVWDVWTSQGVDISRNNVFGTLAQDYISKHSHKVAQDCVCVCVLRDWGDCLDFRKPCLQTGQVCLSCTHRSSVQWSSHTQPQSACKTKDISWLDILYGHIK